MATTKAYDFFMSFTLPLDDHVNVNVYEDLLGLRFDLHIEAVYVEQEMYFVDSGILDTILLQNNRIEDGHFWILGYGSFRDRVLSNS